jgi:hypothetical protein
MNNKLFTCTKCKKKKQQFEFFNRSSRPKGIASQCKDCCKERDSDRYYRKQDQILEQKSQYREENKEQINLKQNEARKNNLEFYRQRDREYYFSNLEENRIRKASTSARRKAQKNNACPDWLSQDDLSKVKSIYKMCKNISKKTGVLHHVDHIVPLISDVVCGLHVPWNLQIIPATENCSKQNKIIEDIV